MFPRNLRLLLPNDGEADATKDGDAAGETQGTKDTNTDEEVRGKDRLAKLREEEASKDTSTDEDDANSDDDDKGDDGTDDADDSESPEGKSDEGTEDESDEKSDIDPDATPDNWQDYDTTITEGGLKDEKGEPFQFDPNDPFLKKFLESSHQRGRTQGEVSELINLYAEVVKASVEEAKSAGEEAQKAAKAAAIKELDITGDDGRVLPGETRIENMFNSIDAVLGERASKDFVPAITNPKVVEHIETLIAMAEEGGAGKGGQGGDPFDGKRGAARLAALRERDAKQ